MAFTKQQKAVYYQKHRKYYIKKAANWAKNNPGKNKWNVYRKSAKHRDLDFTLTKSEFFSLISSPCYYCGKLQENFNGIDRVNSKKGYIKSNCVSCCTMCNRMKRDFDITIFLKQCKLIINKQEVLT